MRVDASETEIIANVALYLKIESGFYILLTLVNCVRFTIQGMGFSFFAVFHGDADFAELFADERAGRLSLPEV